MKTKTSRSSRSLSRERGEPDPYDQFEAKGKIAGEPDVVMPYESTELPDKRKVMHRYTTYFIPAGKAFDLSLEILEIAGKELDKLGETQGKSEVEILASLAESFSGMARRMLERGGHKKAIEILNYTTRDGQKLQKAGAFRTAFTGNQLELYKALIWVLKVNFEDFFAIASASTGQENDEEEAEEEAEEDFED